MNISDHSNRLLDDISQSQQEKILKHLSLVLSANAKINLTRITNEEEAKMLHVEDSLVALPEMEAAPEGLYADLGTGAGYPGIPLAIITGRQTTLVDSVQKKMQAVDTMITNLGLQNQIKTYSGRIEQLSVERPEAFSVVTARALTALPSLLELASPLLSTGGYLISYRANIENEVIDQAVSLEKKIGLTLVSDRKVVLSDKETPRRILCFEKIAPATINLPRRIGMAQKRPLL